MRGAVACSLPRMRQREFIRTVRAPKPIGGEADTVPYSKYVTGCRYPFQQLHSRETTEWVTLVQDQDAKPCAIEKRTNYGGFPFEEPPESASPHTGDTDPGPCIWQAPRVLFSSQSRPPASCLSGLAAHLGVPSLSVDPRPQWPLGPKRRRAAMATGRRSDAATVAASLPGDNGYGSPSPTRPLEGS